ncbi:Putative short-chain dehydrogenase/reductase SDR, NAD(P)-binding domain superfamily [Colletotrichum destructivum]|uniref:Short-chain dehydrogenase/reductase SDR, NAD(P)-binding domain superfamily n=1 Tax=Colletotrichum destructivum TaxID=34406 RepID=A0AAX4J469_9PEZI|nr:Putative short-chain dehydrogenase/reductase SDR, NAD(P)-binding domain superfamily [Colletotrichum destructivum]
MAYFGPETTGDAVVSCFPEQVKGKTFLINGCVPGGLGSQIAVSLAKAGPARLWLLAHAGDADQLQTVMTEIGDLDASIQVTMTLMDPAKLGSVSAAAQEILGDAKSTPHIDALFNIQTGMPRPDYCKTEDGQEYLWQVNFLSQFLLTTQILDKVLSAGGRVINTSSSANKISGVRFHDVQFEEPDSYDQWTAYGQSKTAAILFTAALNARHASAAFGGPHGFRSYAVHPGGVKTKLQEQLSEETLSKAFEATRRRFGEETAKDFFRWKTLAAASSTPLRAALDRSLASRAGMWLEDGDLHEHSIHLDPRATDIEDAGRLWKLAETLIAERLKGI